MRWVALAGMLACATVRPAPPAEAWPFCEAVCSRWGENSLGVILSTPEGPIACGCSITPTPFKLDETYLMPPPWRVPGPRKTQKRTA